MKLNIVIPCYNEEEVLPRTLVRMQALAGRLKAEADTEARILLVDDGSKDRTWELITEAAKNNVAQRGPSKCPLGRYGTGR